MKRLLFLTILFLSLNARSQSVFGYWYGSANVKSNSSANNYLVELVLQPEKGQVKGMLNYYFKNTYRSLQVKGTYNANTRELILKDVPVVYHGSFDNFEVDCIMDFLASLRVAQAGSTLKGTFRAQPDHKYTCADINFNLKLNADLSKKDSVLKAIAEFKETYQVWKPQLEDTLVAKTITKPVEIENPVTDKKYTERENVVTNEIEVESDSLQISIYDNGEIDGDIISLFYNQALILQKQKLTHKSIRINLTLNKNLDANELSMFAENLGLIPPNTALIIISDGINRFELRLSSSMEKNGTIKIKRKKDSIKAKSS